MRCAISLALAATLMHPLVDSFSASPPHSLFDRFRPSCPADPECIRAYDPSLIVDDDESSTWVAVYRSSNNKPSVFVKDEFLNAMKIATEFTADNDSSTTMTTTNDSPLIETNANSPPVAVARLRQDGQDQTWVMDSMRCLLKKEDTDPACDGGSEHTEAIGVAVDALLLHFLNTHENFESAIRTKATLVSAGLLEQRGFKPVTALSKDMATHISSYEACLEQYSKRTIVVGAKNPGARDRALKILTLLGKLDPEQEEQRRTTKEAENSNSDEDDDYDPWAGVKQFVY